MVNSPLYQPQIWLLNSLNQMKVDVEPFSDDAHESNDILDDGKSNRESRS